MEAFLPSRSPIVSPCLVLRLTTKHTFAIDEHCMHVGFKRKLVFLVVMKIREVPLKLHFYSFLL